MPREDEQEFLCRLVPVHPAPQEYPVVIMTWVKFTMFWKL